MIWLGCLLAFGRLEGWYYFQEARAGLSPEEAESVLQMEKERHQNLLALALMEPTRENIANYIEAHKNASEESMRFAQVWTDIVEHGRLDPALAERYFLLLAIKKGEERAARIAKEFVSRHRWSLKGLSLDGAKPEGLDSEIDGGLGHLLPCEDTPCFYAVDPTENIIIPLGSDIASLELLEERILERCEL